MLSRDEAVALFEKRRQAWLDEDIDAYLSLWTEDMSFQSPIHQKPIDRGAFADLVRRSLATTRPLELEFEHLAVEDTVVLAEWRIAIERREGGRRIEYRGMSVCDIRDGLIQSWREYWNPADLA